MKQTKPLLLEDHSTEKYPYSIDIQIQTGSLEAVMLEDILESANVFYVGDEVIWRRKRD